MPSWKSGHLNGPSNCFQSSNPLLKNKSYQFGHNWGMFMTRRTEVRIWVAAGGRSLQIRLSLIGHSRSGDPKSTPQIKPAVGY